MQTTEGIAFFLLKQESDRYVWYLKCIIIVKQTQKSVLNVPSTKVYQI